MRDWTPRSFGVSVAATLMALASVGVATQGGWTPPRTPWGDPDLQGIWTNIRESGTPFERPSTAVAADPTDPEALKQ